MNEDHSIQLDKRDYNVPGTEIDFITGRNIVGVPGQGSIYDVYTMGEIKTGDASNFKTNAKEKFTYASDEISKQFKKITPIY